LHGVAFTRLFSVASGFSLGLHRLEGLSHLLTPIWSASPPGAQVALLQGHILRVGKQNISRSLKAEKAIFSHSKWSKKGGTSKKIKPRQPKMMFRRGARNESYGLEINALN
jgi:hypothetical protein